MRDEVFRVPGRRSFARWIDLDGEPWWLLGDVLALRGYPRQLATSYDLLKHVPADEMERVWVLRPGDDRPCDLRVVSEAGRAIVHDRCPVRSPEPVEQPAPRPPLRRRRRYAPKKES